jgi:hypothetical protein
LGGELRQIRCDIGVVIGIDDGDRLPAAVAGDCACEKLMLSNPYAWRTWAGV